MKKFFSAIISLTLMLSVFSVSAFAEAPTNCIWDLFKTESSEDEVKEYVIIDGQGWLEQDPLAYRKSTQKVEKGFWRKHSTRRTGEKNGVRMTEMSVQGEKEWFVYDYKLGVDDKDYYIVVSEDETRLLLVDEDGYKVIEVVDFGGIYTYLIESKKIDYINKYGNAFEIDLRTFEISEITSLFDLLPTEMFVGRF